MSGEGSKERAALDRLAHAFADDILGASDSDVLAEFKELHGDPAKYAAAMRAQFEKTVLTANKGRLKAAQAGVARTNAGLMAANVASIDSARERLRRLLAACAPEMKLTLAARKEDELSDADMLGMLQDLEELGITLPDDPDGQER